MRDHDYQAARRHNHQRTPVSWETWWMIIFPSWNELEWVNGGRPLYTGCAWCYATNTARVLLRARIKAILTQVLGSPWGKARKRRRFETRSTHSEEFPHSCTHADRDAAQIDAPFFFFFSPRAHLHTGKIVVDLSRRLGWSATCLHVVSERARYETRMCVCLSVDGAARSVSPDFHRPPRTAENPSAWTERRKVLGSIAAPARSRGIDYLRGSRTYEKWESVDVGSTCDASSAIILS